MKFYCIFKVFFLLFVFVATVQSIELHCASHEHPHHGRFQFTCLRTEAEFFTFAFFSLRCHCDDHYYKLNGKCVDAFRCMLACVETNKYKRDGNPEVECFCNTATRTIHNQVMCAWNDFDLSSRHLKPFYVQRDSKFADFAITEKDYD